MHETQNEQQWMIIRGPAAPLCTVAVVQSRSPSTQPLAFCDWLILMYNAFRIIFLPHENTRRTAFLPLPCEKNEAYHGNRGQARCSPLVTDVDSADPLASPC